MRGRNAVKRIFRKNQVIITALAIMIVVAGYLDHVQRQKRNAQELEETSASMQDGAMQDMSMQDLSAEDLGEDTTGEDVYVRKIPVSSVSFRGGKAFQRADARPEQGNSDSPY